MYDHNKTPQPDGQGYLEVSDRLKFWLVWHSPFEGPFEPMIAEDPVITIYEYGSALPVGSYGGYLSCYNGKRIGFAPHPLSGRPWCSAA